MEVDAGTQRGFTLGALLLRQKPAILVSQVKRLECTDSDDAALLNIVGGILVALY